MSVFIRTTVILFFLNFSACSYFTTRHENKALPKEVNESSSLTPAAPGSTSSGSSTPAVAPTEDKHEQTSTNPAPLPDPTSPIHAHTEIHKRETGPVSAEKSLGWLKNGNLRFIKGTVRKDGATAADRMRLISSQKPHAVILSCSDSRVPPEVLFDQKLGEIFVVRTAGEALDNNVVGSIEYGVEHLGANLIVVMGHESCGAIKATLNALAGADMGSPALTALVNDLKPRLSQYAGTTPSAGVLAESWSNVDGVARDLLLRSAILRDAVTSGDVKLVRAMYNLESGKVEFK